MKGWKSSLLQMKEDDAKGSKSFMGANLKVDSNAGKAGVGK